MAACKGVGLKTERPEFPDSSVRSLLRALGAHPSGVVVRRTPGD